MKRIVFMGFLLFLGLSTAFGQTLRISGVVTDAADGSTLPGATVQIKGTTQGTTTDLDGRYEISANANATLVYSFVGMLSKEEEVRGRATINVALESEIKSLVEFVVVGYGTARQVGNVVGNVATVSSEKLESRPAANVMDALQGRVAGMQVYTSSGEPSATQSMRIHGVGSLTRSSTPLYVVDGAPLASGSVLSLNPNDIESVVVLKDASATSIYGARAANGVVFYTTKQGKRDAKATISVSSQYGVSSLANPTYFQGVMNRAELARFQVETGFRTQAAMDAVLAQWPHDTQWYKYLYKDGAPNYQADLSVRGGGGRTTYFISGSYFNQDGLAWRSDYERFTGRVNVKSNANDWLEIGTNVGFSQDHRQTNPWATNSTLGGLGVLYQPWFSPYDENGKLVDFVPGANFYPAHYRVSKEPSFAKNTQINFVGYAQINPINGLTIRTQLGADAYDWRSTTIRYASALYNAANGYRGELFERGVTYNLTNTAEYKFNIQRRNEFVLLVGQEYVDHKRHTFEAFGSGINDDRLMLMGATSSATRNLSHSQAEFAFLSYFGRIEYALDQKYFLDLSSRMDASSRFGKDKRNAYFFSGGFLWNLKKEGFMQGVDAISSLKFRVNAGTSGNSEIGNYESLALIATNLYGGGTGWVINPSFPGNASLTWEKQLKTTLGLELGLFKDRINLALTLYDRRNAAMLLDVPQPFTTGFSAITENVGDMLNRGIDIEFNTSIVKTKDIVVTPRVTFNYNTNEITKLFQGREFWIRPATGVAWALNQPVAFYYPLFAGIDPADGRPTWFVPAADRTKPNRDPNNTTKTFNTTALEQATGFDRYAPISGGFGLDAAIKGFDIGVDFAFVLGKYMINNDRFFIENPRTFPGWNQSKDLLDNYWTPERPNAKYPGLAVSGRWVEFDDRLIEDASFMRLKDLRIGYTIPKSLLSKTGFFTNARFYVSARNLLTFTGYRGPDPEVDLNIGMGTNPNTKQLTMGLNLNF